MRINPFIMPIVLIVALLGTTFTAQALGVWSTSGRTAVDVANLKPTDLKGWMTLQQVIDGLKISQADLYQVGGIPSDTPTTTALKDLEEVIEVTTFREKLTAYLGGTAMNPEVAPVLSASTPTPTATPKPTGVAGATATALAATGQVHATATPLPAGQALPANQIKGKNTLREVSEQCQVPMDKLLAGLKLDAKTDPNTAIKDLISAGKLTEVTDVQKVVAELQNK
ncbi:MAG: hypothetical protein HZB51_27965 [Chloroflexi bacterium]|nr:hypothetical protein [Chloroflexota bacterium]